MPNLKGARTCLETLEMKPNYSELGRIYGIDRRTAKKKYNGIVNKTQREKHSYLDKYIDNFDTFFSKIFLCGREEYFSNILFLLMFIFSSPIISVNTNNE